TGKVKNWALELLGPGGLRKAGLSRELRGGVKIGETITVHAFPSRDGSDSGYVKEFNLSDGRTVNTSFLDPGARESERTFAHEVTGRWLQRDCRSGGGGIVPGSSARCRSRR